MIKCFFCPEEFDTMQEFKDHISTVHDDPDEKSILDYLRKSLGIFDIGYSPILGWHFKQDAENQFDTAKRFDKKVTESF